MEQHEMCPHCEAREQEIFADLIENLENAIEELGFAIVYARISEFFLAQLPPSPPPGIVVDHKGAPHE